MRRKINPSLLIFFPWNNTTLLLISSKYLILSFFFRQLVDDLPMTAFLENAMPHSLPILEAIYAKLNSNGSSINTPEHYSPEHVVWQIVKYFASQDEESVSPLQLQIRHDLEMGWVFEKWGFGLLQKTYWCRKFFFWTAVHLLMIFKSWYILLKNAINFNCDHGLAVSKVTCYTGSPGSNPGAVACPLMFDMERMNLWLLCGSGTEGNVFMIFKSWLHMLLTKCNIF